jgi:hypothetical protein
VAACNEFARVADLAIAEVPPAETNRDAIQARLLSDKHRFMHDFAYVYGKPGLARTIEIEVAGYTRVRARTSALMWDGTGWLSLSLAAAPCTCPCAGRGSHSAL